MTNAELIAALRYCKADSRCGVCEWYKYCESRKRNNESCLEQLHDDAAAALEAAEKRIAELEKQMPKRGEWIEKWRFKTDGTPFHKIGDMECSVCHGDMLGRYYSKYCPHCGALLRGEHDGET